VAASTRISGPVSIALRLVYSEKTLIVARRFKFLSLKGCEIEIEVIYFSFRRSGYTLYSRKNLALERLFSMLRQAISGAQFSVHSQSPELLASA